MRDERREALRAARARLLNRSEHAGASGRWDPIEQYRADQRAVRLLIAAPDPLPFDRLLRLLREGRTDVLSPLVAEYLCARPEFGPAQRRELALLSNTRDDQSFRALVVGSPHTPLALVRELLQITRHVSVTSAASRHPEAVRDPVCRQLIAPTGKPYVIAALTLAAPEAERAAWLVRLAEASPRVFLLHLERGHFQGWPIPTNALLEIFMSKEPWIRERAAAQLALVTPAPESPAAERPRFPRLSPPLAPSRPRRHIV